MRRYGSFLRAMGYDFALVIVLATALSYAVLSGFEATMNLRMNIGLSALLGGIMLVMLYAGSWSRSLRVVSIVGAVVYAAICIVVAIALAGDATPVIVDGAVNDVEGNYAIFVVVVLTVAVLCYLLSRTRPGMIVLAVLAVFCCGVVQFLFRDWSSQEGGLVVFLVVLCASVALYIYRRYYIGVTKSEHNERVVFGQAALLGLGISALAIALSGLAFSLVIAPMNLSTPLLKPFEYYIIPPITEYTGAYDQYLVENPDEFSSLLNEREDATTQNAKGGSVPDEEQVDKATNPFITFLQSIAIFSEDDWSEDFDPVSIERMRFALLVLLLLFVLATLAVIIARIRVRDRRLRKLEDKPLSERVVFLYEFLLTRLDRLGLGKPETSTPLEFAFDSRRNLVPFTRRTGQVDFVKVTLVYQRAVYAGGDVSEEDYDCVRRYYRAFFNNAHRHVGTPRWLWKFWRI